MAEVGFFRRIAPAVVLAAAGGVLLYLLPSGADTDLTLERGPRCTGAGHRLRRAVPILGGDPVRAGEQRRQRAARHRR